MNYHIVGAGRGIGRWFAENLKSKHNVIYCYDIAIETLNSLSVQLVKCPIDEKRPYSYYINLIKPGDIILLAIPQNAIDSLKEELLAQIDGVLAVCLTSVQSEPMRKLQNWDLKIQPLGCHPLFGPTLRSPVGQLIALTMYMEHEPLHASFETDLRRMGLIPTHLSPEDHDRHMGVVQALTHFCFLIFSKYLSAMPQSPSTLSDLRTPNFQFLQAFACRFLMLAPTTTGAIQFATDAKLVRSEFLTYAKELDQAMTEADSIDATAILINEIREQFNGAYLDEGAQIAEVAVDSVQRFENLLHQCWINNDPFVFCHRVSKDIHIVRILQNNSTDIEYEEATVVRGEKYAIGLDEISKRNYGRIGLSFGRPHHGKVKKRNIIILTGDDLSSFWKNSILPLSLRLNVMNPHKLGEEFFEEWLPKLAKGVYTSKYIESYRHRGEPERVTIEITYDARMNTDEITETIRLLAEEFKL